MLEEKQIPEEWLYVLKRFFKLPASVIIIIGRWKTGKTDFALFLGEELFDLGYIQKCGTNIKTSGDPRFEYVTSMERLKQWLFQNSISKVYIYDESITSTPSRRAMSKLNTEWLKVIPELSKGRAKLIVITQETDFTEGVFKHKTFTRGFFIKKDLKTAQAILPLESSYTFHDIPKCQVGFDPYLVAPFTMDEKINIDKWPECCKVAWLYRNGLSMDAIGREFNPRKHRYSVALLLRKHLKHSMKSSQ